jgi:hypothetical protein
MITNFPRQFWVAGGFLLVNCSKTWRGVTRCPILSACSILIAQDALDDDPLSWLLKNHVTSLPAAGHKYVNAHLAGQMR